MAADLATLVIWSALTAAPPLTPCVLTSPGLPATRARCGAVEVPKDRAAPGVGRLSIGYAVLEATGDRTAPDPIVVLPGGPGQAGTEVAAIVEAALDRARKDRDVVLFDPRGTGRSGKLSCSDGADIATRLARTLEEERARLARCAGALPLDPRLITTEAIARDLEDLRIALGAERLNLVGISYGTRLALTYDRLFPGRARALVLDGVVPASMVIGEHAAKDAEAALALLDARCAKTPGCPRREPLPDLLRTLLQRAPRAGPVALVHPTTGKRLNASLDRRTLIAVVRLMLYAEESAALLPTLLAQADAGDVAPLLAQALLAERLEAGVADGMQLAVLCAEDQPFLGAGDAEALFAGFEAELQSACSVFPHAAVPPTFHDDVPSPTPALLLSGEADPVTPPAWGDAAARALPRSVHVKASGVAHNVVVRGCAPELVARFLARPDPAALDVSCAARIGPLPLFIDALGPAP
ncbi:MAG: alpha/beta fold hydrolase [Deltaproteobacteria bacterium]|nr:alpha/beta fold hydrolase [Deltaproteobacteria bacterium]